MAAFPHPFQLPVVSALDAAHTETTTGRSDVVDIALVDAVDTENPPQMMSISCSRIGASNPRCALG